MSRPTVHTGAPMALMRPRNHWLVRLLGPVFGRITLEAEASERLQEAHSRGLVVHVLRAHRVLDPVYILYALERLGLPLPRWLHDHYTSQLPPTVAELVRVLQAGEPALLFLRKPRTLINASATYSERHVESLIALQRTTERPILLMPEAVLWEKRAAGLRRTIIDSIFGDREAPGAMREILGFFWHGTDSRFHVGNPIDLAAVLEREKGQTDRVIAKKIRWALLNHLAREEHLRTGPVQRSAARVRQNVLKDPAVRRYVAHAEKQGQKPEIVEKNADQMLRTVAADMRYGWLRVVDAFIDLIWSRIYDGIVVDQEGLAKVRRAARMGPVVLVPSHKSHVDYLVLSQVFFKEGMMPPHIAAGDNLNFPPVGYVFRRSGAFFMRRSFKGDKLYAVVFAAYVRRLLKEGHAVEFFIEGGRSRTGKLLPPKMGLLTMCVDPVLDGAVPDVHFIPVSISYEKIVEARSYAKELAGGEKKKEDVTALLSSAKVLRSRYGRVYVDFAEPVSLRVFASSRGYAIAEKDATDFEEEPTAERKQLIHQLGHRLVYGINQVIRVTPTSLAAWVLLSRTRKGIGEAELQKRADRVLDFLEKQGVRSSPSLSPNTRQEAIREALGRFATENVLSMIPAPDGETIYQLSPDGRRALDYYKNSLQHFFVPYAIVATAVLTTNSEVATTDALERAALRLSRILKYDFSFRVDTAFSENFAEALRFLVQRRVLEQRGELWALTTNGRAEALDLAGSIATFLEGYRLAAETLAELEPPATEKRFITRALDRATKQILEGRMKRPEAAAKSILETAIQLLIDQKIVRRDDGLKVVDPEGRKTFVNEVDHLLSGISDSD